MKKPTLITCLLLIATLTVNAQQKDFPNLTGPYLGQKPPGIVPEEFGVGVIDNNERVFALTFSPDGKECFYTKSLNTNTIMTTKETNRTWKEPSIAGFSGRVFDFEPHIRPDGSRIAFVSERDGHSEIYIMNADGTNQTRLTYTNGRAINPEWKPVTDPTSIETGSKSSNSGPENFQLFQNYPNPFNPSTHISFDIPAQTHVRLEVFNALGRLVKTLVNDMKSAGSYSIMWDGMDNNGYLLPTGLYYYRLKSGNFYQVQKALFMK